MTKTEKKTILDRIESASYHYEMGLNARARRNGGNERRIEYCETRLKTLTLLALAVNLPDDDVNGAISAGKKQAEFFAVS